MEKILFILLVLLSSSIRSEVFKCQLKSGKTVYQSTPCESTVKQQTIKIQKSDPRKVAEEEAKLKAWEQDFATREAAKIKVEKELQDELDKKASIEALKKSAEFQQQQAYEAKRQADALERQYMQPTYQQYPIYPSYGYPYPSHIPHQHDINEKTVTGTQQSEQSEIKTGRDSHDDSGRAKLIFKWK